MTQTDLSGLSDRTVLLALQELTEELSADAAVDSMPLDQDEAALLVGKLLHDGGQHGDSATVLPDQVAAYAAARRVLAMLASEPATADVSAAVLRDPPTDSRLSAEIAGPGIVVLAALVTWLQTKVVIHIKRVNGKTEFEFRVAKEAATSATLKELASTIARLLGGAPRQLRPHACSEITLVLVVRRDGALTPRLRALTCADASTRP